jgi:hypothetical protein
LTASVHRVIAAYVAHLGGKVVVSGPLQIQLWPGDHSASFTVALKCLGRKPKLYAASSPDTKEKP